MDLSQNEIRLALFEKLLPDVATLEELLGKCSRPAFRFIRQNDTRRFSPFDGDLLILDFEGASPLSGRFPLVECERLVPNKPILVLGNLRHSQSADGWIEQGAHAYLCKRDLNESSLINAIFAALAHWQNDRERPRLEEMRAELLASLNHEISTPVSAVIGYTKILLDAAIEAREKAHCLDRIAANASELERLIARFRRLAPARGRGNAAQSQRFPLLPELARLRERFKPQLDRKRLRLNIRVVEPIPAVINSDPQMLTELLSYFVENAIQYTEEGSVTICVRTEDRPAGVPKRLVEFTIDDTGCGLAKGIRDSLSLLTREHGAFFPRPTGGLGTGLATAQRLAGALGGTVEVIDRPGALGATFRVTIDANLTEAPETAAKRSIMADLSQGRLAGLEILLVDDCEDLRILIARSLERFGAQITLAENGSAALDLASQHAFDLIVMDLQMPVLDGCEATSELRRRGNQTPIVALTAHAIEDERERALQAGCNQFFTKPLNYESFIEYVESYRGEHLLSS